MLTVWRYIFVLLLVITCPTALAAYNPIGCDEIGNVPTKAFVGKNYAVTYRFTNNSPFNIPVKVIRRSVDPDYVIVDGCSNITLAPKQQCKVLITLKPTSEGRKTLKLNMRYSKNICPIPTVQATARKLTIKGNVDVPLPTNTAQGVSYPVVLSFTNTDAILPATNVHVTTYYPGAMGYIETLNTCKGMLGPRVSCQIAGFLKPRATGPAEVVAKLSYDQGGDVLVKTQTTVTQVTVNGHVDTPLPANTAQGANYPVVFSFTNSSTILPATNLRVTTSYPAGFTQTGDTCTGVRLLPQASCQIAGELVPISTKSVKVGATLSYAEGTVVVNTTSTSVSKVTVNSSVDTPLPANAMQGQTYPVVFSFKNSSAILPATHVRIASNYPAGFTETSNNCTVTLPPHTSCQIAGNFTPTTTGPIIVAALLSYSEGINVVARTHTRVANVTVNGTVSMALPANIAQGLAHPVVVLFTNTSAVLPATNVRIIPNYPAGFAESSNTCTSTLAARASCQVAGYFTPTTAGPAVVETTFAYDEGMDVVTSTHTNVTKVTVNGSVTTSLPANTAQGLAYPVVFSFTNSNATLPVARLWITTNYPAGFNETSNDCVGSLAPHASCQIAGDFTPTIAGPATVGATLSYSEGTDVVKATNTSVTKVTVNGRVDTSLPSNTAQGTTYPVVFSFINSNKVLPATNVRISSNYPASFTETSNTCTDTLAPGASCQIGGNLKPTTVGPLAVGATLFYAEGTQVANRAQTNVTKVTVNGSIDTPLPTNTAQDVTYPVVFSFTNSNVVLPATKISVATNYPAGFTQTSNTCAGTLAPFASCYIAGNLKSTNIGPAAVGVTLSYAEGADVVSATRTAVAKVTVNGSVDKSLPTNTAQGLTYPVILSFKNTNAILPVTSVRITPNYPTGFRQTSNNCTGILAPLASCQIAGDLTPRIIGPVAVGATMSYAEGADVVNTTRTSVTKVAVNGSVDTSLPANTAQGLTYPVVFSFTNSNALLPATKIAITANYPSGFTETSNTCKSTLAPLASCQIAGDFTPTSTGPVSANVTLSYAEGTDVVNRTRTTVSKVTVSGRVDTPLPANTAQGQTYMVMLSFTNDNAALPATNVRIATNYPSGFTETSKTCKSILAPLASCEVTGDLTPTTTGPATVGATLSFDEGADVVNSTTTNVSQVTINGTVDKTLSAETSLNGTYPVSFTFTNSSLKLSATNVKIIPDYPAGFTERVNQCKTTLAPQSSCKVLGTFRPTVVGPASVGVTLSYAEGADVKKTTTTNVKN